LLAFPALSAQNQLVYNSLVSIDSTCSTSRVGHGVGQATETEKMQAEPGESLSKQRRRNFQANQRNRGPPATQNLSRLNKDKPVKDSAISIRTKKEKVL